MKTIIKHILTVVFLVAGLYTAEAQVKIGSNPTTPSPTSNLEVEGVTGSKFVVTKDSSKVGIGTATPSTKLELNSGKTDQSGFRFTQLKSSSADQSGTLATLTVDQNGYVGKSSVPAHKMIAVSSSGVTSVTASTSSYPPSPLTTLVVTDPSSYVVSSQVIGATTVGVVRVVYTGIYKVYISALMGASGGAAATYTMDLHKNGVLFERLGTAFAPIGNADVVPNGTTVMALNAGDYLTWVAGATVGTSQRNGKMIIERMK